MTKKRWTAAWTATLSVSIPIDAGDPETAMTAKDAVDKLAFMLRADHPGSTVEIVRAGFGKVEVAPAAVAAVPTETQTSAAEITELPAHLDRRQKAAVW